MAINGIGKEYDFTFDAHASVKTTTSQYLVCGMQVGTSTVADHTVALYDATTTAITLTARYAIGAIQTYQSAGSDDVSVRMFGIGKVKCADSVTAGQWIFAYEGASTSTFAGHVVALASGLTTSVASVTSQRVVLGRALENGQTNTVISAFINPQLYDSRIMQA